MLDFGASEHMTFDLSILRNIKALTIHVNVILRNSRRVKATHTEKVIVHPKLTLNTILLVPYFKFNLLSVHRLCTQFKSIITFSDSSCFLHGFFFRRPLVLGDVKAGLYLLYSTHYIFDSTYIENKIESVIPSSTVNIFYTTDVLHSVSVVFCDNL